MPAINWLMATVLMLFLCGFAIATPFVLGMFGS